MTNAIILPASRYSKSINNIALGALITCLCIFPWLHGIELVWQQLFFCGSVFTILLICIVNWQPVFKTPPPLKFTSICFFLWLILMAMYLVPLPAEWVSKLAPATYQWYQNSTPSKLQPLSLYPQVSFIEVIKYASLGALFLAVYKTCDSLRKIRILFYGLVLGATVTALYSLLNFATNGAFELVQAIPPWDLKWSEGVRGTFSYKNQYAMYLVMSLSISFGLLIEYWFTAKKQQPNRFPFKTPPLLVLVGCTMILLFTLLNTSSRGALISLALATGCVIGMVTLANPGFRAVVFKPKFVGFGAIVFSLILIIFSQTSVFKRFTESQFEDNGRVMLHQTAISVIAEFAPAGTGPGTYPYIQHYFKNEKLGNSAMSKRAHNDYLETIATQGFIGAGLLLSMLMSLMYGTIRKTKFKVSQLRHGIYIGLLAYIIQSSFDVNVSTFYLPAFFVVLLAIGNRLRSGSLNKLSKLS
ncbi:O-antigen ligase family protein [Alteromonas sp. ASW11-130]|uniref:O-antigen ligase family protein n=1 Tax=Alteromonas sp. ASW11-130 TaxID=3015775 RepID=UPI0022424CEB|nr:O-antigen ligase family protein [Alteromonas sp. ASW11-130]MCW8090432.1 O-antigen ligase family protein [Alteromonas sp. ASW11-130]